MFNKNKSLNKKAANDILQNVFEECNVVPNSTPFDKLILHSIAETKFVTILKYIAIGILAIILLLPLTFRRDSDFVIVEYSKDVTIENHALFEDCFVLTLAGSSIDYDNIYAKKDDGAFLFPKSIDKSSGIIIFPYGGEELNLYIPSGTGDMIHAILHENRK